MQNLTGWALTILENYGALILLFIAFFGSLGIPFPITPVIIAAGALARQGMIDWRLALIACLAGAVVADHSEYFIGRRAGGWLSQRFGQKFIWQKAQATIDRQGSWAILLTRFWLTSLAPAVNVIAGIRYPYARFLFFDLTGEVLWVILYGGLGYFFAGQWEMVSRVVSGFSGVSFVLLVFALVFYFLVRPRAASWQRKISQRRNWPLGKAGLVDQPKRLWIIAVRSRNGVKGRRTVIADPRIQKINHSLILRRYDWISLDARASKGDFEWNAHHH